MVSKSKKTFLHAMATVCLVLPQTYALSKSIEPSAINTNTAPPPYTNNIVHFADEEGTITPNRLLTLNYDSMELLATPGIPGALNHHADPLGTLDEANYMMMIPKGSNYVTTRKIRDGNPVKTIRLPFRPRSADAYNEEHDLVFLNARDRPAGVLIDATSLKIVGKAGFNIRCDQTNPATPIDPANVYASADYDYNSATKCLVPDFGGDQVSGHPLWISSNEFVLIDRANRLLHVYKIERTPQITPRWSTTLVQTIQTSSSLHQLIPEDSNNPDNDIFYGMTEGNEEANIIPSLYKYQLSDGQLGQIGVTELEHVTTLFENLRSNGTLDINALDESEYKSQIIAKAQELKEKVYNDLKNKRFTKQETVLKSQQALTLMEQDITSFIELLTITSSVSGYDGHNLYITPNINHLYAPVGRRKETITLTFSTNWQTWEIVLGSYVQKGGIFVVDTNTMDVHTQIKAGNGAGHVAFSEPMGVAIVTNHLDNYVTAIDYNAHTFISNIDLLPIVQGTVGFGLTQSHSQHISEDGQYYYNFWADDGVFFRIDLDALAVDRAVHVGGIPIQGSFYKEIAQNNIVPPAIEDGYEEIFGGRSSQFIKIDSNETVNSSNGYNR